MTSSSSKAIDSGTAAFAHQYVVVEITGAEPRSAIQAAESLLVSGVDAPSLRALAGLPRTSSTTDALIILEAAAEELGFPTRSLENWPEAFGDLILETFLENATPSDLVVTLLRSVLNDVRDPVARESFDRVVGLGLIVEEYPHQRDELLVEMHDAARAALTRGKIST